MEQHPSETLGILLAGGKGTRLQPLTGVFSKHLLAVYDKPMIYYPISTFMLAGVRRILIFCMERDLDLYQRLLGDGSQWGLALEYKVQTSPNGIAEPLVLARDFIGGSPVMMVLGDNLLYGPRLGRSLSQAFVTSGAKIFAARVSDPENYGVVEFDDNGSVISLEEKPLHPKSNYAIPGIYFFDPNCVSYAESISPSERGELEIIDVLGIYLESKSLSVEVLPRGVAWLDTGTFEGLHRASEFVKIVQDRQGLAVCSPDHIYKNSVKENRA